MDIKISDHFDYKKLIKICISPILMMIFISLYSIVDGLFVSNFGVNKEDAFAGINIIFPATMIIGAFGFMLGVGGTALVSKYLGQGKQEKADRSFSMILLFTFILGVILSLIGFLCVKPICYALGSIQKDTTQGMVDEAIKYGRVLMLGQAFFITQNSFHSFFQADGKPKLGFYFTLAAGVTNMIFDALFIAVLNLGVIGAGIATVMGYLVGSFGPFIYFLRHKNGNINLVKTKLEAKIILKACKNGIGEFVSNISGSVVSILFNAQLLKYIGQNGVSAYGQIMYVSFIFLAILFGYNIGVSPIIGYNYGARNNEELHNVFKRSLIIVSILNIIMFVSSFALARPLATLFFNDNDELINLTTKAMRIYSVSFIFCGLPIFASGFFTALNKGIHSAVISILRTFLCQVVFVLVFPLLFAVPENGIWWAIVGSEVVAFICAFALLLLNKKKYGY